MDERRRHPRSDEPAKTGTIDTVAAWRVAKASPDYKAEAGRQSASAAFADDEDGIMDWVDGVGARAWDER